MNCTQYEDEYCGGRDGDGGQRAVTNEQKKHRELCVYIIKFIFTIRRAHIQHTHTKFHNLNEFSRLALPHNVNKGVSHV